jgi:tetratricopeptide (TPR) repeat protein
MEEATVKGRPLPALLILAVLVLACYWPVQDYGFVNYDDPLYVTDNQHVQAGLTWEGFVWAFQDMKSTNWHPLTWLSHMTDWQLFQDNAAGHHWTNVLLHLANTLLLFHLFRIMTGMLWQSALVAAIFAVHPLNVESVVWIAERKNLLSTCFGWVTLLFYVRYLRSPGWKRYLPAMAAFSLSLMAKPMLVTLPFLMLLLDYWPLGRFCPGLAKTDIPCTAEDVEWNPPERRHGDVTLVHLITDKIPFLILTGVSILITILAADRGGAVKTLAHFPLSGRLTNALHSYASYIGKYLWPQNLAVFYPNRAGEILWQTVPALLLMVSVTLVVIHQRRTRPYLAVGWFWFLGTLVPVIGLVQVGLQAMADRYAYVPFIGLSIMLAWGVTDFCQLRRQSGKAAVLILVMLILTAGVVSRHQIGVWENSRILFSHALKVTQKNEIAHNNLAYALYQEGDMTGAVAHFREAVKINPLYMTAHNNLGILLARQGKIDEAISEYEKTLKINPRHGGALFNMGLALVSKGKLSEAKGYFELLVRVEPDHVQAHQQLGVIAVKRGSYDEAITHFQEALRLSPGDRGLAAAIAEATTRSLLKKELDHGTP